MSEPTRLILAGGNGRPVSRLIGVFAALLLLGCNSRGEGPKNDEQLSRASGNVVESKRGEKLVSGTDRPRVPITGEYLLQENCFVESIPIQQTDVLDIVNLEFSAAEFVSEGFERSLSRHDAYDEINIPEYFYNEVIGECFTTDLDEPKINNLCKIKKDISPNQISAFQFYLTNSKEYSECLRNVDQPGIEPDLACNLKLPRDHFILTGCDFTMDERDPCVIRSAINVKNNTLNSVWTNFADGGAQVTLLGRHREIGDEDKILAAAWFFTHKTNFMTLGSYQYRFDREKLKAIKFPINVRLAMCPI